ncbi:glycosyltransferase, partial [Candidatus Saccharibacteria bacterium]|nr:glycosyltransferase [Candidatus Saccharibacteria bacterium]
GTSAQTRKALTRSLKLDSLVNEHGIVFFDYIDDNELISLYRHASFLLYTSKSEGFGLPALEAAKFGCPVVAAYATSIPEVLGTNCLYVNPYSIDSIKNGIMEMSKEEKRACYKADVEKVFQDLIPRIQDSTSIIIKELLNG